MPTESSPPGSPRDEELVAATLETGEQSPDEREAAFVELVSRYRPVVTRWVHARLAALGPADVEDVVQEIWLRVWLRLSQFDARKGSFRHWLSLVVSSETVTFYRKLRRRPILEPEVDTLASVRDEKAHAAFDQADLLDVLDTLDPDERELLQGQLDGKTFRELASERRLSLHKVYRLISSAMQRLSRLK